MVAAEGNPLDIGMEKDPPVHIEAVRSKITGVGLTVTTT
jgi:hypothetical protein